MVGSIIYISDLFHGLWPGWTRSQASLDVHRVKNALKQNCNISHQEDIFAKPHWKNIHTTPYSYFGEIQFIIFEKYSKRRSDPDLLRHLKRNCVFSQKYFHKSSTATAPFGSNLILLALSLCLKFHFFRSKNLCDKNISQSFQI